MVKPKLLPSDTCQAVREQHLRVLEAAFQMVLQRRCLQLCNMVCMFLLLLDVMQAATQHPKGADLPASQIFSMLKQHTPFPGFCLSSERHKASDDAGFCPPRPAGREVSSVEINTALLDTPAAMPQT